MVFLTYLLKKINHWNVDKEVVQNLEIPKTFFDFHKTLPAIQPAFTCSKLTIESLEQGVKYVQSYQ